MSPNELEWAWLARLVQIAQVASPIVFTIGAFVAYQAFRATIAVNKFSKSVDVMMKCSDRYDAIHIERAKLDRGRMTPVMDDSSGSRVACRPSTPVTQPNDERDVEMVYKRFWGLQQFQHEMFALGLIELGVYQSWLTHKARLFHENEKIGGITFREGWEEYGKKSNQENVAFTRLIAEIAEDVVRLGRVDEDAVRALVVRHRDKHSDRRLNWLIEGFDWIRVSRLIWRRRSGAN